MTWNGKGRINVAALVRRSLMVAPLLACPACSNQAQDESGGVPCTPRTYTPREDTTALLQAVHVADGGTWWADGGAAGPLGESECAWYCNGEDAGSTLQRCAIQQEDGAVVLECSYNCDGYISGRRTDGLGHWSPGPSGPLAAYWAATAYLEWASVAAFARMSHELEHHGAPASLVHRARSAMRDEEQHARWACELAACHGASVQAPVVVASGPRGLRALGVENLWEGCLRETLGAAVVSWQSLHASRASTRKRLARVARDEVDHAQLSWDVHAWLMAVSPGQERTLMSSALRAGAARLASGAFTQQHAHVAQEAGYPSVTIQRRLARQLASQALLAA